MTSQAPGNTLPDEPCVIFNISETEVDPDFFQLPYPPKLSLKRQVSESFLHTRGYIKKQRRIHSSGRETAIDCPCLPPPAYNIAMTGPSSNFHSAYSTLPTTPPTPENETHPRRPSQVTEIIEKVNAKLRRLFGSRRGSVEDVHTSFNATVSERPSVFHTLSGPSENSHIQRYPGDHVGMSVASLPNTTFQARRRNTMQTQSNCDLHYDGDGELEQLHSLQSYSTQSTRYGGRKRKDSQFSFSDLLRPRRFSKAEKGKGRMEYDEEAGSTSQDQLLHTDRETSSDPVKLPLTEYGTLPLGSSDQHAGPSTPSSAAVSPMEQTIPIRPKPVIPSRQTPTARKVSVRLVPPTPAPPRVQRRSSTSSTASSSSVSSFDSTNPMPVATSIFLQRARDIVNTLGRATIEVVDANGHSQPISIPSSHHNSRRSSILPEGSARPLDDSPTLPPSLTASTAELLRHGDRPDTAPSSPSLDPTLVPSLDTMQTLHLGPPQRALLQRSVSSSSSRMFHVSVEHLSTPTPAQPVSRFSACSSLASKPAEPISRFSACSSLASKYSSAVEHVDDTPDFSITHPAPPSPVPSSSPALEAVPSPVKRRTGSLEGSQDLRAVYIEQGRASVITCPPRQRSPRKSLQGRCWWDESPPKVYL